MNGESDDKNISGVGQPAPRSVNGDPTCRDSSGTDQQTPSEHRNWCFRLLGDLDWSRFPHVTVLPGLQFSLAGMLGKPQTFYQAGTNLASRSGSTCLVLLSLSVH